MTRPALKHIVEAALLAHSRPLSIERLANLFEEKECPSKAAFEQALNELVDDLKGRGIELTKVATGYRIQVKKDCLPWVSRLWEEKPPRYSRAMLETLALIAYRQPISRGDIEDVRGVVVSSNIMKTLMEREWIRIVGYRDVPGRPALYATTPEFLDYFGLENLESLPSLAEIREFDDANRQLDLDEPGQAAAAVVDDDETAKSDREEDVLAETADDLATAEQLMMQVEHNLFGDKSEDEADGEPGAGKPDNNEERKGFAALIKRMQERSADPSSEDSDAHNPTGEDEK
ncbi:MAG: SMC-Scp complex subunit ScpB [Oceanobacter sp.]